MTTPEREAEAAVRCAFCATFNRVDVARAVDRPKCGECDRPMLLDRPVRVQEEDFERTVLEASVPVLVDFFADWCAPCRMIAPLVDELALEHAGHVLVAKVDTDRAHGLAERYQIRSIPTLVLFRDGREAGRSMGYEPEKLRALVSGAA